MWIFEICCGMILCGVTMFVLYSIYLLIYAVPFMSICVGFTAVPVLVLLWLAFVNHVRELIYERDL